MGEIAGMMLADQPGNAPILVIPFVALTDDAGDRLLVATEHLHSAWPCEVWPEGGGDRFDPVTFESVDD